ncbi:MAG: metal-binding protein [Candidatus Dadabacteria bacterium]|nr:metal-binding protein [Candidatus Dadabacteria bacterium]
MKHRKSKIKRQHSLIKGLQEFLEKYISNLEYVTGVIPGEIKVSKATGENLTVKYKYETVSGAKLIAKSGTSIQEVFVITKEPEKIEKFFSELNPS